jgi:hypothetical protein
MIISVTKNKELAACGILWDTNGTWVFQIYT